MNFLIDADSALYKAGCAGERRWYEVVDVMSCEVLHECQYKKDALNWIGDEPDLDCFPMKEAGPLKEAIYNLKLYINNIINNEHCDTYQVFVGGSGNYRREIDPEYKVSRNPLDKPFHIEALKDCLVKEYGAVRIDRLEVDDVVSILSQRDLQSNCIVSIDKDLLNTQGWHFNPDTLKLEYITEEQANLNFYRQLLTGDSTDGIIGIKGYGKAAALRILPKELPPQELCAVVWGEYQKNEHTMEYFVQQGQLLWMLREENVMWYPPMDDNNYFFTPVLLPPVPDTPKQKATKRRVAEVEDEDGF